jgi:CRISPR-associated protein Csd2
MKYPESVINPANRHDFVLIFDVTDGNPNGDPDAGNLPRVDPETMQGIVTDVALKRKIRDYISLTQTDETRQIYVKHRGILSNQHKLAYDALEMKEVKKGKEKTIVINNAKDWMCQHFYDVRLFGAVMSSKKFDAGQVRGPVQLTFSRSVSPIMQQEITITRVALTNGDDVTGGSKEDTEAATSQMGRKAFTPYGLYVAYGFFSPAFAEKTGVNEMDLQLLWQSLEHMWEFDRSASRGRMACRGLYVFTHDNSLGCAPAHRLFELIQIEKKANIEAPRFFHDYVVSVDDHVPDGVTLHQLVK